MANSIESSILKIEELVSNQSTDQNTMLLYYANLGRSNENSHILFSIDNPYAFPMDDIRNILNFLSEKAFQRILQFNEQSIEDNAYFNSMKYCYLLWLCCVSIPLDEANYSRVKNIFKILETNNNNVPDLFKKELLIKNLSQSDKNELLNICSYIPTFLRDYHVNNSFHDQKNIILEINKIYQKYSIPHINLPFFFDTSIKMAIEISHFIPKEIVKRMNKKNSTLTEDETVVLYFFCLISLHVISYLLNLNFNRLSIYTCLTLLDTESKILLSDKVKFILDYYSDSIKNPDLIPLLENIKNKITIFLTDKEEKHLDALGETFSEYITSLNRK